MKLAGDCRRLPGLYGNRFREVKKKKTATITDIVWRNYKVVCS